MAQLGRPKTNNSAREDFKVTRCNNKTIQRLMKDFDAHHKKMEFFFNAPLIYDVRVMVTPALFTPLRDKNIRYFDLPVYQVLFSCETAQMEYQQIKALFGDIVQVLLHKRKSISEVKSKRFKAQYHREKRDSLNGYFVGESEAWC